MPVINQSVRSMGYIIVLDTLDGLTADRRQEVAIGTNKAIKSMCVIVTSGASYWMPTLNLVLICMCLSVCLSVFTHSFVTEIVCMNFWTDLT